MQMRVWWMIAAALCAVAAHGDGPVTANWLPTTAGTYTLTDGANWDTGVAPTNGVDIANFAPGAIEHCQLQHLGLEHGDRRVKPDDLHAGPAFERHGDPLPSCGQPQRVPRHVGAGRRPYANHLDAYERFCPHARHA